MQPLGTMYNEINYNKKIALVLGIGDSFKIKNVIYTIKFSQHIPVKIYKDGKPLDLLGLFVMPKGVVTGYGFGQLLLNLSIPLD